MYIRTRRRAEIAPKGRKQWSHSLTRPAQEGLRHEDRLHNLLQLPPRRIRGVPAHQVRRGPEKRFSLERRNECHSQMKTRQQRCIEGLRARRGLQRKKKIAWAWNRNRGGERMRAKDVAAKPYEMIPGRVPRHEFSAPPTCRATRASESNQFGYARAIKHDHARRGETTRPRLAACRPPATSRRSTRVVEGIVTQTKRDPPQTDSAGDRVMHDC